MLQVIWSRVTARSTIASVIPRKNVYPFVMEQFEIKVVRGMYHLLVKHRVRITKNDSWSIFIVGHRFKILWRRTNLFKGWKKHTVKFSIFANL